MQPILILRMKFFILLVTATVCYSSQDTTSEKPWDSPFERAAGGASNTMAAGSAAYNSPQVSPHLSAFKFLGVDFL